jgi:hypothetical protein
MYCTIVTAMCRPDIRVDLAFRALLLDFNNFNKKNCPKTYPAEMIVNRAIPAVDVLNSTKKSATI